MSNALKRTLKLSEKFTENAQKAIADNPAAAEKIAAQSVTFEADMRDALRALMAVSMSQMMRGGNEEALLENADYQSAAFTVTNLMAHMVVLGMGTDAGKSLVPAGLNDPDIASIVKQRTPDLARLAFG